MEHTMQPAEVSSERRAKSRDAETRLLRLTEVLALCGKSRSSVYDAMKRDEFPKPVKLSGRSSAWVKTEIDTWIYSRIRARDVADA